MGSNPLGRKQEEGPADRSDKSRQAPGGGDRAARSTPRLALGTFEPDLTHEIGVPCDQEVRRWLDAYAPTMKPSYEILNRGLIENHLVPHFGARDLRTLSETDLLRFARGEARPGPRA